MKSLELSLNKRFLIVELPGELDTVNVFSWNNKPVEKICEGSELTEEIAYELVDGFDLGYFVDYNHHNPRAYKLTALESFISAVEASGYHWGENPVKEPIKENYGYHENINVLDTPPEWDEECYYEDLDKWQEAEIRTLNPEKCIIFEIL